MFHLIPREQAYRDENNAPAVKAATFQAFKRWKLRHNMSVDDRFDQPVVDDAIAKLEAAVLTGAVPHYLDECEIQVVVRPNGKHAAKVSSRNMSW